MAKKPNYHTTPNGDERWKVQKEGSNRASKIFDTQADAIKYGRELSKKNQVEHVIHRKNGQIRDKDSYGNDPRNIKG